MKKQATSLSAPHLFAANFTGTATLQIDDSRFAGPFAYPIELTPTFTADRNGVHIEQFPEIRFGPISVFGLASVTTIITRKEGGRGLFDSTTGHATIPITFSFDHSIKLPFISRDSDLPITLTTEKAATVGPFRPHGAGLNRATGAITLVGAGHFVGGFLHKTACSMVVTGRLSPLP